MRYDMQNWDTTSFVNPTRMNHIEQGIYDADLRNGGTINGNLGIDNPSTSTSEESTWLQLGNNIAKGTSGNSTGKIALYGDKNSAVILQPIGDMTSGNKTIKFPDQAGTVGLQDKVTILAQSTGSKTYAQHIATLKEVWDTLSNAQRMKCMIRRRDQYIYVPTEIGGGIFTMTIIDSQKIYVEILKMSNSTFGYLSGTTYTELSNTTVSQSFILYLPL